MGEDTREQMVVVVTGASAGLGRAIAHAFAERGAKVGLLARNPEALKSTAAECRAMGGEGLGIPTDVSDAAAVEAAAAQVERELGPIDVWVNNAMVSVFSPVKDMEAADYKRVTDVLYLGFVHGTMAALKRMLPRNRGTIVQIGSALAYRSIPLQSAYCGCKHAINGFTDSLRCELIHDKSGVKLTQVHMPAMNTWQFYWVKNKLLHKTQPVPPIYEPEVCARVVVEAATAKSPRREYWVGAPTVKAIVAQRFIPGLLDKYLAKNGYESQQLMDEPRDPHEPDNLYSYVPGRHSARGKFEGRSKEWSAQVWASLNRNWLLASAGVLLAAGAALVSRRGLLDD
jgi:NADP-dependent 3-hydroxy acid dehydrogenase YdfG